MKISVDPRVDALERAKWLINVGQAKGWWSRWPACGILFLVALLVTATLLLP